MSYNATCRLKQFVATATGTDNLRRTWAERDGDDRRCQMIQASVSATVTAVGEVGPKLYHCSVYSPVEPQVGWRIEIRLDGDEEEHTYTVRDCRKRLRHWHLLVERG
jgi:hypothetical protein